MRPKAIETEQMGAIGKHPSKIALVIGNGNYPDASAPLAQRSTMPAR